MASLLLLITFRGCILFFERHDKTRPDDGGKGNSPWKTAWLLWGGDSGRSWANSMYHKINGGSDEKTSGWNDRMHGNPNNRYVPLVPNKYVQDKVCSCGGRLHYGGRADLGGTGLMHCDDCAKTWTLDQTKSSSAEYELKKFYHVAPTAARHLIERDGLVPNSPTQTFDQFQPREGVHLFSNPDHAYEWADRFADMYPDVPEGHPSHNPDEVDEFGGHPVADIWESHADLPVEQDPRLDNGLITNQAVPSNSLRRIDSYRVSDMSKYRDQECPDCGSEMNFNDDPPYCPECDPPESRQASWNDVMQWSGDAFNWASEKGIDVDAAIHRRLHPNGCEHENCWICNNGERPKPFEDPKQSRSRHCPPAEYRQWNCPLCDGETGGRLKNEDEETFNQRIFDPETPVEKQSA